MIGWGSTGSGLPTTTALRQATVPLENVSTCNVKYRPVNRITIGASQVCAGFGSADTCSGDSGGAMLSSERTSNGHWAIIGITSFGVGCADPKFPGVYTRVDKYLDWIQDNL
jgi:secreted trypsin-like serine protease